MRMLIDARHREETRVAVVKGNRIEEFDFESAERKQLKGNIYLAKVTRVEPSLQAAFVEYGGNRHGFLAFSEIHPDYYQIPKEDRDALLREEAEHAAEEEALRARQDEEERAEEENGDAAYSEAGEGEEGDAPKPQPVNGNGSEDAVENLRQRRMNLRRRYKIQDVIRRRQVLLVQVVKEERGNKGAALTTYLSLAGRYCVLMPNTSHGGGISRKISNAADRKRLKSIMAELNLPKTMGCIVRTAGLQRTKTEIKRDFDYLARLWDEIREKTLQSAAPALIYEDSDLSPRARLHEALDAEPRQKGDGLCGRGAAVPTLRRRGPAGGHVPAARPAQIRRLSGDQPYRGARLDRHQLRPLDPRAQHRADRAQHQPRSGPRDRPSAPPARHGGPRRHRLHRHGEQFQQPQGREGDEGGAEERPRPHPGRPHLQLRPVRDEPPAAAHRRARSLHPPVPALRRHRPRPHRLLRRPVGAQDAGGRGGARAWFAVAAAREPGSGLLCAQPQAR
jgi:hypothetical protein